VSNIQYFGNLEGIGRKGIISSYIWKCAKFVIWKVVPLRSISFQISHSCLEGLLLVNFNYFCSRSSVILNSMQASRGYVADPDLTLYFDNVPDPILRFRFDQIFPSEMFVQLYCFCYIFYKSVWVSKINRFMRLGSAPLEEAFLSMFIGVTF
jgi:hypothetical protein